MKSKSFVVGIVLVGFVFMAGVTFLVSLIPTLMWYTFDDRLATVTQNPEWGTIPWYNVYGFTIFVTLISKSFLYYQNPKIKASIEK